MHRNLPGNLPATHHSGRLMIAEHQQQGVRWRIVAQIAA